MRTSLEVRAARGPKVVMAALLLSAPTLRVGATPLPVQAASAVVLRTGAEGQAEVPSSQATPPTQPSPVPPLAPLALAAVSAMALVVGRRRGR